MKKMNKYPRVKINKHSYYYDLSNCRFGRLIVKSFYDIQKSHARFLCKCDCGNETIVKGEYLISGHKKSCGCLQYESRITHNMSKTRLYRIWHGMIDRCVNKNDTTYSNYGGRGIKVCPEWQSDFMTFKTWAEKNGYTDSLTIERKDVNGDYCPENCEFIAFEKQLNNTTRSVWVKAYGKTQTLIDWIKELNLQEKTIYSRVAYLRKKRNWIGRKEFLDRDYDELFEPSIKNK